MQKYILHKQVSLVNGNHVRCTRLCRTNIQIRKTRLTRDLSTNEMVSCTPTSLGTSITPLQLAICECLSGIFSLFTLGDHHYHHLLDMIVMLMTCYVIHIRFFFDVFALNPIGYFCTQSLCLIFLCSILLFDVFALNLHPWKSAILFIHLVIMMICCCKFWQHFVLHLFLI